MRNTNITTLSGPLLTKRLSDFYLLIPLIIEKLHLQYRNAIFHNEDRNKVIFLRRIWDVSKFIFSKSAFKR